GRACCPVSAIPGAPSPRTRSTGAPDTPRRSWSADTAAACPGSRGPSSRAPLPLLREAPFFDEVLGQLQPHHQFPDLGAGERQLAVFRLAADPQAPRALLQEDPLPALELVRGHLALPRDRIERFPAEQPQHQLRLPRGAPAFRQLGHLHRRRFTPRSRLPLFRAHPRPPWLLSS